MSATAHAETILILDPDGTAELLAADYGIDTATPDFEVRPDGDYPEPELTIHDGGEVYGDAHGSRNRRASSHARARTTSLHDVYLGGRRLATYTSKREAQRHCKGAPTVTYDLRAKEFRVWSGATYKAFSIAQYGSLSAARVAAQACAEAMR